MSLGDTILLFSQKLLNEKSEEVDRLKKELVELREYTSQLERGDVSDVSAAYFIYSYYLAFSFYSLFFASLFLCMYLYCLLD